MTVKQLGQAEPVARARQRDVPRHGHQHPLRPLHREHLRRPRGVEPRLRARAPVRALGFVLLRRDRPNWPRPIKLPAFWAPIAGLLARLVRRPRRSSASAGSRSRRGGYGDTKEKIIGVRCSSSALLLFLFRRIVQDGERPHWREETPTMPDARVAGAPRRRRCARLRPDARLVREGRPSAAPSAVVRIRAMEGSRPPQEFEVAIAARSRRPRRSARRSTQRRRRPSARARRTGSTAIPPSRSGGRSGCSRPASPCSRRVSGEQVHGMTANAFMSVSLRPPLVLISIDRRAKMAPPARGHAVRRERPRGGADGPLGSLRRPRRRRPPEPTFELVHETPLVEGALAHLVARVVRSYWGGDHSLFLGQVEFARYGEGRPLLFHGGRYERLDPRSARLLAASARAPRPDPRAGRGAGVRATARRSCGSARPGADLLLVVEGSVRVERPGLLDDDRAWRARRRDRGARPGSAGARRHPCGRSRPRVAVSREQLLVGARGRSACGDRADRGARCPLPRDGVASAPPASAR